MPAQPRSTTNSVNSDLNDQIAQINSCLQDIKKDNQVNADNYKKIHDDLIHMKDEIIKNLVNANKELQTKVSKLEEKVYELSKETTVSIESNNQYVRRNNIEISGIPNKVADDVLEDKVIEVLELIDVKVKKRDIEACHRLPPTKKNKTKRVIVRFVNRKKSESCLLAKKKLADIDPTDLNFKEGTKLYLSENFNSHFRTLAWNCRELRRGGLINKFKYQNEAFILTLPDSDEKLKVTHVDDLSSYFHEFYDEY